MAVSCDGSAGVWPAVKPPSEGVMLRFDVYKTGRPAGQIDLSGAYLFTAEGIPVRADLVAEAGRITVMKQREEACGLALLWQPAQRSRVLLNTTRLPERPEPYNLNLELARGQVARLFQKWEDWSMFDLLGGGEYFTLFGEVREQFVEAMTLNVTDAAAAAELADRCLDQALLLSERMTLFHADATRNRRAGNAIEPVSFGCRMLPGEPNTTCQNMLHNNCDFIHLPTSWQAIEPQDGAISDRAIQDWFDWAERRKLPVHLGPLVSFQADHLPDWLTMWDSDFELFRQKQLDFVTRMAQRYGKRAAVISVIGGLNAINPNNLGFEQIVELTERACSTVRRYAPKAKIRIDLIQPFSEYYARNIRTIPATLFAEMIYQRDIKADAFGLELMMGVAENGYFVRDLMQIGSLLDQFVPYGKAIHLSACGVPSSLRVDEQDAWGGTASIARAGTWHADWSQRLQAEWLQAIYRIGSARPFVDCFCWADLADLPGHELPNGGLLDAAMEPKSAWREFKSLRAANRKTESDSSGAAS
jgi:hypothetical protein